MNKRPTSITVISWIMIVIGVISLVSTAYTLNNPMALEIMAQSPMSIATQITFMYVALVVTLVCGVGFLKGKNWARILYVVWTLSALLMQVVMSQVSAAMIPSIVVFLIVVLFLFRSKANIYFSKRRSEGTLGTF